MSMGEFNDAAKALPEPRKLVYTELADPGVQQLGKALGTVANLTSTALYPVEHLNAYSEELLKQNIEEFRARLHYEDKEEVIPAPPEITIPVVNKLGQTQDPNIVSLYVELLVSASTKSGCGKAHPSFVNIIGNMSPDDVRIMNVFKKLGWGRFLFEQRRHDESLNTWSIFARAIGRFRRSERMLNFSRITEVELSNPEQFQRGIYNLTALNLISVEEGPGPSSFLGDDDEYQQLDGVFDEMGVKTQRKYPPLYFCSPLGVSFLEATDSALRKNVLGRFSEEADQQILEAYTAWVAEIEAGGPAAAEHAARIAADFEAWKRKRERSNKDGPESA